MSDANLHITCPWRILNYAEIQRVRGWYDLRMRNLVILLVHLVTTIVRLVRPGGVRAVVAESVLAKHQLLILNRFSVRQISAPWIGSSLGSVRFGLSRIGFAG
jgi:hypothetical protein